MKLEAENLNEPQKQPLLIADVIGWLLFSAGIFNFISYLIWFTILVFRFKEALNIAHIFLKVLFLLYKE